MWKPGCRGEFLFGPDATDGGVGSLVAVDPQPACCRILHLLNGFEQGLRQPVIADGAVVAFDIGVLLRLHWLDMLDPNAVVARQVLERVANVLGPVIAAQDGRLAAPCDVLLQRPDRPLGW